MSEEVDYICRDAGPLERRAAEFGKRIRKAKELHLEKQAELYQRELDRLDERLKGHRLGYEEFLGDIFDHTVDECGLLAFYEDVAEHMDGMVLTLGKEELPFPMDCLDAYGRAVEHGVFTRFELLSVYEIPAGDELHLSDSVFAALLGQIGSRSFVIHRWDPMEEVSGTAD